MPADWGYQGVTRAAILDACRCGAKTNIGSLMYRNIISASLLFTVLGMIPVNAADLKVYKFLEFGAIATDNLQLFGDQEELVFSVKPSVELSFEGNRFDTDVLASVEAYSFSDRGDTIVDPRLNLRTCLLYTSPSPRDATLSRMPSSA